MDTPNGLLPARTHTHETFNSYYDIQYIARISSPLYSTFSWKPWRSITQNTTSKLCVRLLDVTQSADKLLTRDWLVILQQIPRNVTQKSSQTFTDANPRCLISNKCQNLCSIEYIVARLTYARPLRNKLKFVSQYVSIWRNASHTARHITENNS